MGQDRGRSSSRRGRARDALATVLGYVQAQVVASACRHVPISREMVGPGGLVADPAAREAISQTLQAILRRPVELPVACTLGPDDGAERMRRWHQLVKRAAPIARRIGQQLEVRFQSGPGVREELKALAASSSAALL